MLSLLLQAPISQYQPRELSEQEIEGVIQSFVDCALKAQEANYDGIEILGAGGYLISEFLTPRTNRGDDRCGGSVENRVRFAVEIVRCVRAAVRADFIIISRFNGIELVEDGNTFPEIPTFTEALVDAGVSMLNVGIGWHEARVPTVVSRVSHGAWSWVGARYRAHSWRMLTLCVRHRKTWLMRVALVLAVTRFALITTLADVLPVAWSTHSLVVRMK